MIYPQHGAGFKGSPTGPGADGARYYQAQVKGRRLQVLQGLEKGPGTAEQIGERVGLHWYLARPRLSELKALGFAVETGQRAPSAFGGQATVYRVTTAEERDAFLTAKAAEGAR